MEKIFALKKRKTFKIPTKIFLLLLSIFLLVIAVFILFSSLGYFDKKEKKLLLSYQINNDIAYKVYLKPNNYLEEESLDMNQLYIAELIDYIEIEYSNLLTLSQKLELNYNYSIDATIYGKYKTSENEENSKIWSKSYNITPLTEINNYEGSNLNNSKTIKLYLDSYQNEVADFKKNLKLSIDTSLKVKFSILINSEDTLVNEKSDIEISIPLDEKVFAITTNYEKNVQKDIYEDEINNTDYTNWSWFTIGIISAVLALYFLYKCLKIILKSIHKSEYIKKLSKIKRDYDEIIVEVSSPLNIENYHVIEVKSFEEMIDLEEEIRVPILLHEKDFISRFAIIHQKIAYLYILYDEDKYDLVYDETNKKKL